MKFALIFCIAIGIACAQNRDDVFGNWQRQVGNGQVFGKLGQNDEGLYGKGGYKQDIFNDDRGRLQGQAYGSRVLGPYGDKTRFGGRADWSNDNANVGVDVNKERGGRTRVEATGQGTWNLGPNTHLSAGGSVSHEGRGRPDVQFKGNFEHKWGK